MTNPENPKFFVPSPHFDEKMNEVIGDSEIEGGVKLENLSPGSKLKVETSGSVYEIEIVSVDPKSGFAEAIISGNPKYFPVPTRVNIPGSNFGGSMIKVGYIGRGLHMEVHILEGEHAGKTIATSKIKEIEEVR